MSKSIEDPAGTILLSDAPSEAAKKIMSATTDSLGEIRFDLTNRPGISNLLQISAALSGLPLEEVRQLWEGKTQYGDLKKHTADLVVEFLAEFQTHLAEVDTAVVTEKLEHSETAMRHVANDTLHKVQRAVGLRNS